MAQVVNLTRSPSTAAVNCSSPSRSYPTTRRQNLHWSKVSIRRNLQCNAFFSDNRKEAQARKALESALGGKKAELERWDNEIKKRAEAGGGGDAGGGGWFGRGGWFGWSNGDPFWQEAQQTSLAVLGIILMYLTVTKGEVMLASILNPLLFALRGTRRGFRFITSWISQKVAPRSHANFENIPTEEGHTPVSARERVVRKWGSD